MYENRKVLQGAAIDALKARGYEVDVIRGGGSRLRLTKDGASAVALVRTSSDRWMGWMRDEQGDWRGLDDGQLVVVAALSEARANAADVYALHPDDIRAALDQNLASREAGTTGFKKTAPIFVSIDEDHRAVAVAAGAGFKRKALWTAEISLTVPRLRPPPAPSPRLEKDQPSAHPSAAVTAALENCRREISAALGVEPANIDLQLAVRW